MYSIRVIPRAGHAASVRDLLRQFPVVGLIGARQVGKTTLARSVVEDSAQPVTFFDLEDPTDEARLSDPKLALEPLRGLVVIDEVQRLARLFELLRVLVDRPGNTTRFLVLGSAGPDLLRQSSETLAGRIAYHELTRFGSTRRASAPSNGSGCGAASRRRSWRRRRRQRALAERVHPDVPRARPAAARRVGAGGDDAAVLDDGGPLPRQPLEERRGRPRARGVRSDHRHVPRHAHRCAGGAPPRSVVREPQEAAGQGPPGLRGGHRAVARATRARFRDRAPRTPEGRGVVGGVRHAGGGPHPRRGLGPVLLLGHAPGSGARSAGVRGGPPDRARVQADERAADDPVDALGVDRPRARPPVRGVSRRFPVRPAGTSGSGGTRARRARRGSEIRGAPADGICYHACKD